MKFDAAKIRTFRKIVLAYYQEHGRHALPWRQTTDPYKILVSEVMLQQTQVERVIPFYTNFIKKFPTPKALAAAPLADVLIAWQGLGYNRRAQRLQQAAREVVERYKGKMPASAEELETLPGIGHYTARAVAAFAHNSDAVFIETNIRAVVMYHFFAGQESVHDQEIMEVLSRALPKGHTRAWYSALMDSGSHLQRSGVRTNPKSTTYKKQSTFAGSPRQARGSILRALLAGPQKITHVIEILGPERRQQVRSQIASLVKEGLVELKDSQLQLPQ